MEKNYHSRLLLVSNRFDSVIEKLKTSYIDQKYQLPWWQWLLLSPVRDFAKVKSLQNGIEAFFKTSAFLAIMPFLAAFGGWILSLIYPFSIPFPESTVTSISFLFAYIASMILYYPQLLSFKSDHFHTGAYRLFRRQEYDLFQSSFMDEKGDFFFRGLYDYVTSSSEGQRAIGDLVANGYKNVENLFSNFIQNERTKYESTIHRLEESNQELKTKMEELNNEYQNFNTSLIADRDDILQQSQNVVDLLKDLNTLLFRIHNKGLTTQDLDILTGFTLYEVQGNKLVQIEDRKTSGVTPKVIDLDDPKFADYGVVKVVKENLNQPFFNHPYSGHVVVSYKMRIDNSGTWVYNFHFDESNTKAWKLLVENDIIESKEIYRLVHAITLLTINFKNAGMEGAVNQ